MNPMLDGLKLSPRGRPPEVERDVAVWLATLWFKAQAGHSRAPNFSLVADLWAERGFPGLPDVPAVSKRARSGEGYARGNRDGLELVSTGDRRRAVGEGAGVLFLPDGSYQLAEGRVGVRGDLWAWTYGEERARCFNAGPSFIQLSP